MSIVKSMYNEKSPKFELESKSVFPLYIPRNNKMFQKVVLFLSLEFFPGGKLCSIFNINTNFTSTAAKFGCCCKNCYGVHDYVYFCKNCEKKKTEFARGP